MDLTSPEGKTKLNQRLPRNLKTIQSLLLPRNETKLYQHLPSIKTIPSLLLPSHQNHTIPTSPEDLNHTISTSPEEQNHTISTSPKYQNHTMLTSPEYQNHTMLISPQCQNHTILIFSSFLVSFILYMRNEGFNSDFLRLGKA